MYITINDIIGEKRINLSYPICSSKEVAVITMLSQGQNEKCEYTNTRSIGLAYTKCRPYKYTLQITVTYHETSSFGSIFMAISCQS